MLPRPSANLVPATALGLAAALLPALLPGHCLARRRAACRCHTQPRARSSCAAGAAGAATACARRAAAGRFACDLAAQTSRCCARERPASVVMPLFPHCPLTCRAPLDFAWRERRISYAGLFPLHAVNFFPFGARVCPRFFGRSRSIVSFCMARWRDFCRIARRWHILLPHDFSADCTRFCASGGERVEARKEVVRFIAPREAPRREPKRQGHSRQNLVKKP